MTEVSAGTLTDFLLHRITDTIAEARYVQAELVTAGADQRGMPFLLAEHIIQRCYADRQIVKRARTAWNYSDCTECNEAGYLADEVLRLLALPYAGHAEFNPVWSV